MTTAAPARRPVADGPTRRRRVGRERPPVPVLILAVLAIAFFALPFLGLLWKAPWGDAWSILTSDSSLTALRLSLSCSAWATVLAVLLGVPLAWLLARTEFPGRTAARALCTVANTWCPVSAARNAIRNVSTSRSSPTRTTSGSCRSACRNAWSNDGVSLPTSSCEIMAFFGV